MVLNGSVHSPISKFKIQLTVLKLVATEISDSIYNTKVGEREYLIKQQTERIYVKVLMLKLIYVRPTIS